MRNNPPVRGVGARIAPLPVKPPESIEAEQSVLGGLMLDGGEAWQAVSSLVGDEDFIQRRHRVLFRAMGRLIEQGKSLDVITVSDALERSNKLGEIGGGSYIAQLARDTPSAANLPSWARIVREKSLERQMLAALHGSDIDLVQELSGQHQALRTLSQTAITVSAPDLCHREYPSVRWAVPAIVPEGVSILAGSPKIGKSWLCLALCTAVASGGVALGHTPVAQGGALYLALEDNERRLQRRMRQLLANEDFIPEELHFATRWPRLNQGCTEQLDQWLTDHPGTRLVVIDTLERIRPPAAARDRGQYSVDYIVGAMLLPLAEKHGVAIILTHHTRKAFADDPVDMISGTLGLTGGVDGTLVLRRQRGQADASLYVTGRDIEDERDYALAWDQSTATWTIKGNAKDFAGSQERLELVDLLRQHPCLSVMEIAQHLNPGEAITRESKAYNSTRQLVFRARQAGRIEKRFDGKYQIAGEPLPSNQDQNQTGESSGADQSATTVGSATTPGGANGKTNGHGQDDHHPVDPEDLPVIPITPAWTSGVEHSDVQHE